VPGVTTFNAPVVLETARRHGLIETETLPGMLLERDTFAPVAATCDVDEDALPDAQDLVADVFGVPREWFDAMYDRKTLERSDGHVYVLREDGRAVSTAVSIHLDDAVGIFNVATPTGARGRGLGAAVTSCAIERGFADGCAFAFLQTSALGESVYRRLGFELAGEYTLAFAPPH
jgi:predicted GNAT family acetyltransferase